MIDRADPAAIFHGGRNAGHRSKRAAIDDTLSIPRVLAMWAMMLGSAQGGVLTEQQSPVNQPEFGAVVAVAFAEPAPQTGRAQDIPESCPYHFGSDMPAATFCVYQGVAFGGGGEVCATDVVVIWSSVAAPPPVSAGPAAKATGSNREVYLAFVAEPELVLRGIADARQDDRAEMVGYTTGGDGAPQPLAGRMTLRAVRVGSSRTADVLSMELQEPRRFHPGSCALASYSGTFLGMARPPSNTTRYIDTFLAPRQ